MTHANRHDGLLHGLYAAVGDDAAWNCVLERLARTVDATIAMLVVKGRDQRDQAFYAAWNHPEPAAQAYSKHWWRFDPFIRTGVARGLFRAGVAGRGSELVPDARLRRLAFYRRFMTTMPARHLLFGVVADGLDGEGRPPVHLSLFRPPQSPDFSVEDVDWLRLLLPHVQHAFDLHWRFRRQAEQVALYQATLSRLECGVLLLDPAQHVHFANVAAHKLLAGHPHDALTGLPRTAPKNGPVALLVSEAGEGRRTVLPLNTGSSRLLVMSAPLSVPKTPGTRADTMLLLVDQDAAPESLFNFLAQGFGLSPAETRLLPSLYLGETAIGISRRLGVKTSTVRSQLASIFAKTGCRRQQDLVRLLGVLPRVSTQSGAAHGNDRRRRA